MNDDDRSGELAEVAMPSARALAGQVTKHLAESVLAPLAIFYFADAFFGLWPALGAAAAWTTLAIVVYLLHGGRPSSLLVASAALALLQLVVTAVTQEAKVFFVQPAIATYIFAIVMAATTYRSNPIILRLALDFVPLPPDVVSAAPVRRFFRWLSLLWALVLLINASITLYLLFITSTRIAVPVAIAASVPAFLIALFLSYRRFLRAVHAAGYLLVWGAEETTT